MPKYDVHRIVDVTDGMGDCVAAPRTPYRIIRSGKTHTIVYSIHARDITAALSIAKHMESYHTGLTAVSSERPYMLNVMKGERVAAKLLAAPHVSAPVAR